VSVKRDIDGFSRIKRDLLGLRDIRRELRLGKWEMLCLEYFLSAQIFGVDT